MASGPRPHVLETAIAGLIADREFIGRAWMRSLAERDIPFILRIKDSFHVRLSDGRYCQVNRGRDAHY